MKRTYNRAEIMNTAHAYRKQYDLDMSEALRAAWLKAKAEKVEEAMDATGYKYNPLKMDFSVEGYRAKEEHKRLGYELLNLDGYRHKLLSKAVA